MSNSQKSDAAYTGNVWGDLTGVKPLKLYRNLLEAGDEKTAGRILSEKHGVDPSKIELLEEINRQQLKILEKPKINQVSVYIGIPFCPTRCTYCSFTSNQKGTDEIRRYMQALYREIEYVSGKMNDKGLIAETLYIGGGTPTTLEASKLREFIDKVRVEMPVVNSIEFTVEAGRPDTIDREKLEIMREAGVTRISINPQTMKDESLKLIGRGHSADEVRRAFEVADEIEFHTINADLIAGLPGENFEDFRKTLNEIEDFGPENITVHTLALKKGSRLAINLMEKGENLTAKNGTEARVMVDYARDFLKEKGYKPYYIYRQKYMADNLENVGYAREGYECIYNIRIMEEKQTVIAMGAGGSTKVFFPEEDRLERVFNVSNYEQYIDRIDEMITRKEEGLFEGGPY